MSWFIFVCISIFLTVTYSLISKKILNDEADHNPITYASALFGVVALYSLILYIFNGVNVRDFQQLLSPDAMPLIIVNLICYTVAPSVYYRALKHMPISEVTILYALTGLFAFIFAILLGSESFVFSRLLGGVLIIGAVAAVTWKANTWRTSKYVPMMVVATALYAVAAITDTKIIANQYFSTLFFQALSFGVPAILILLINRSALTHIRSVYNRQTYPLILLNGFFFFLSFFAIYQAYAFGGDTSQVSFALSTETIVVVIFAALALKEKDHLLLKFFASVVTVIGLVLIR